MTRTESMLLGRDHPTLGEVAVAVVNEGRTVLALAAGASPVIVERKGPDGDINEDAVLAIDMGERVLLAVADGHRGAACSHLLLERLRDREDPWPNAARPWAAWMEGLAAPEPERVGAAGSTLLVAVLDRARGRVSGVSYGDSLACVIAPSGRRALVSSPNTRFVRFDGSAPLDRRAAEPFQAPVEPGSLVVLHSDGVNECCYGRPKLSLSPKHVEIIAREARNRPVAFAEQLVTRALEGVDGNPGGEDNVAVAVARA